MIDEIVLQKKALRKQLFEQRNALTPSEKEVYDNELCSELEQLVFERSYKVVHVYLPMGSEINIKPFIQHLLNQNIKVVSPKTLKNRELQHLELSSLEELENGIFGTMHPTNSTEYKGNYDLVIVPGLAFDSGNYRLGYGGGYYDKFLEQHPAAFKIGICYPFQKMASVPKEAHDVCLDKVLAKPF